jgi:hypothetical protein
MSSSRGLWQLTDAMTDKKRTVKGHTYWRHKTTGLWWSRDPAGHGGSAFKVYLEDANGNLVWFRDADQYGDFISPQAKHKGPKGRSVTSDLIERGE